MRAHSILYGTLQKEKKRGFCGGYLHFGRGYLTPATFRMTSTTFEARAFVSLFREPVYTYFLVKTPVFALVVDEGSYFVEVNSSLLVQNILVDVNTDNLAKKQVVDP